jgi:uncharacterized membrane protein YfcA
MDTSPLFFLLGVIGAIFANSTGAGGGVVFVPVFHSLGFSDAQVIGTSFGIQSFGMTVGALAWSAHFYRRRHRIRWEAFLAAIAITAPASIAGLWTVYLLRIAPPATLSASFAVFSLFLGVAILMLAIVQRPQLRYCLETTDRFLLAGVSLLGGGVTAWLSVGVGEFVAFYLIARRYDVTESIAVAVVLSAVTVWSASPQHFGTSGQVAWSVVLLAGPGAVVGALCARALALRLGALRLKRWFGIWLVFIGLAELWR